VAGQRFARSDLTWSHVTCSHTSTLPIVEPSRQTPAPDAEHAYDDAVKVSTRGDYASRALLSLALHQGEGPTSVRDIAERTGLPQPYLEQILLALKGAGLVRSKRGVGGGYFLARPPEEITLAQIVAAVDGPIRAGDFGEPHTDGACDHEGQCVLLAIWADVSARMKALLDAYTLADLSGMTQGRLPWPGEA
jgi:Rrf2 family iron-sulfur cluster assembly transcriptional regulator